MIFKRIKSLFSWVLVDDRYVYIDDYCAIERRMYKNTVTGRVKTVDIKYGVS